MSEKRTVSTFNAPVFTLPDLEINVGSLDEFLAEIEIPVGLPLFELYVNISSCRDLALNLEGMLGGDTNEAMPHHRMMDCIRLLKNRLIVLGEVFKHGKSCCKAEAHPYSIEHFDRLAFQVQDQYDSIESAMNQCCPQESLPLQAICSSLASCIGVCDCIYDCGGGDKYKMTANRFAGRGNGGASQHLDMITDQLALINKALEIAQDKSVWVKKHEEAIPAE